jgi:hypothetical protein
MNPLREAAQFALDALHCPGDSELMERVEAKLRAALAEPEPYDQQALELCEVCGWKTLIPGEGCLNCERQPKAEQRPQNCGTGFCSCIECPYVQPKAEQEPVAYIGMIDEDHFTDVCRKAGGNSNTPLYAAPQPRKRLADEEIMQIMTGNGPNLIHFARAIEAAVWGTLP